MHGHDESFLSLLHLLIEFNVHVCISIYSFIVIVSYGWHQSVVFLLLLSKSLEYLVIEYNNSS
jgi:hypothetical protein